MEGAEPGDLLVVDVLEVSPEPYGYTAEVPGFGFLREEFPEPFLVKWAIEDMAATSPDIPGVRIPGAPFMGIMGLAPSRDLMQKIAAQPLRLRDARLKDSGIRWACRDPANRRDRSGPCLYRPW